MQAGLTVESLSLSPAEQRAYPRWYTDLLLRKRHDTVAVGDLLRFVDNFGIAERDKQRISSFLEQPLVVIEPVQFYIFLRLCGHLLQGQQLRKELAYVSAPVPKPRPILSKRKKNDDNNPFAKAPKNDMDSFMSLMGGGDSGSSANGSSTSNKKSKKRVTWDANPPEVAEAAQRSMQELLRQRALAPQPLVSPAPQPQPQPQQSEPEPDVPIPQNQFAKVNIDSVLHDGHGSIPDPPPPRKLTPNMTGPGQMVQMGAIKPGESLSNVLQPQSTGYSSYLQNQNTGGYLQSQSTGGLPGLQAQGSGLQSQGSGLQHSLQHQTSGLQQQPTGGLQPQITGGLQPQSTGGHLHPQPTSHLGQSQSTGHLPQGMSNSPSLQPQQQFPSYQPTPSQPFMQQQTTGYQPSPSMQPQTTGYQQSPAVQQPQSTGYQPFPTAGGATSTYSQSHLQPPQQPFSRNNSVGSPGGSRSNSVSFPQPPQPLASQPTAFNSSPSFAPQQLHGATAQTSQSFYQRPAAQVPQALPQQQFQQQPQYQNFQTYPQSQPQQTNYLGGQPSLTNQFQSLNISPMPTGQQPQMMAPQMQAHQQQQQPPVPGYQQQQYQPQYYGGVNVPPPPPRRNF